MRRSKPENLSGYLLSPSEGLSRARDDGEPDRRRTGRLVPAAPRRSQEVALGSSAVPKDWLRRAENNRILEAGRPSIIRSLAEVLDVSIGDLIGEPVLLDWTADSRTQTVPALRAVLMDYSQLSALLASGENDGEPPALDQLARKVDAIFEAYQHSRFGYVTAQAPELLQNTRDGGQGNEPSTPCSPGTRAAGAQLPGRGLDPDQAGRGRSGPGLPPSAA